MCNQRERLIGYVYDEGSDAERGEVQRHLDTCAECRAEIAALRRVREDLLAWDVPDHESVWRPFAPAPVQPWWRQVPAWALSAAAGVVMLSGAAGAAAVHAMMPVPDRPAGVTATATPAPVTADDLAAAEQRWRARLEEQMGSLGARVDGVVRVSNQLPRQAEGTHAALTDEVTYLRAENRELNDTILMIYANLEQNKKVFDIKAGLLETKYNNLYQLVQTQLMQPQVK